MTERTEIDWNGPLQTRLLIDGGKCIWVDARLVYETQSHYVVVYAYPTAKHEMVLTPSKHAFNVQHFRNKPEEPGLFDDEDDPTKESVTWDVKIDRQAIKVVFNRSVDSFELTPEQVNELCQLLLLNVCKLKTRDLTLFGGGGLQLLFRVYADFLTDYAETYLKEFEDVLDDNVMVDYRLRANETEVQLILSSCLHWKEMNQERVYRLFDLVEDKCRQAKRAEELLVRLCDKEEGEKK